MKGLEIQIKIESSSIFICVFIASYRLLDYRSIIYYLFEAVQQELIPLEFHLSFLSLSLKNPLPDNHRGSSGIPGVESWDWGLVFYKCIDFSFNGCNLFFCISHICTNCRDVELDFWFGARWANSKPRVVCQGIFQDIAWWSG